MSTSPDCSAVKRCCAVSGTYLTFSGSPKIAAAIARQMSMLNPVYLPWLSGCPKPGVPCCTPQLNEPACLTLSRVGPACAAPATPTATASATMHPRSDIQSSLSPYRRAGTAARLLIEPTLSQPNRPQQRGGSGAALHVGDDGPGRGGGIVGAHDRPPDNEIIGARGDRLRRA